MIMHRGLHFSSPALLPKAGTPFSAAHHAKPLSPCFLLFISGARLTRLCLFWCSSGRRCSASYRPPDGIYSARQFISSAKSRQIGPIYSLHPIQVRAPEFISNVSLRNLHFSFFNDNNRLLIGKNSFNWRSLRLQVC